MKEFLQERLDEGYNLIVVKRKQIDRCYWSKDHTVEESGTLDSYDEIMFSEGLEWPYIMNVIYNISELIEDK